jgi:hypothetical protein
MGSVTRIYPAERLLFASFTGQIGAATMRENRARVVADPAFKPDLSQLMDFTGVVDSNVTFDEMYALATRSAFSPGTRIALVVPNALTFGLARMFQSMGQDVRNQSVALFTTVREALAWLGAPADLESRAAVSVIEGP